MQLTGGCFCGAIRYSIRKPLRDARSCHCSQCRKAFSAQASAFALVEPDSFTWTDGQHLLASYLNQENTGLQFCSRCGSTLCGVHGDEVFGVTLGCLDDDADVVIERHIYVASKAAWEKLPEDIEAFDEDKP
ncbi:MAG: GFA family protein [Gammaproteobacteria bacterium]|nr:GFA family protein [Gammaproteobacteria bacterium]